MAQPKVSPEGPLKPLVVRWSDAIGRTIKSVIEEPVPETTGAEQYLVFRFTDGSGLVLKYREGGDGPGGYDDDPEDLGTYWERRARVYFGIDSMEQYLKAEQEVDAEFRAREEARERAQLELLKRKYGESK